MQRKKFGLLSLTAIIIAICFALPAFGADEVEFSKNTQLREQLATNGISVKVFSNEPSIDTSLLTSAISGNESDMMTIAEKVNKARKINYPDAEVMLVLSDDNALAAASLVKSIYWWNNHNPYNGYWWAKYSSKISACFAGDVAGTYKLYHYKGGIWNYLFNVTSGAAFSNYDGGYNQKGCKGLCKSAGGCSTDVVMYFYSY